MFLSSTTSSGPRRTSVMRTAIVLVLMVSVPLMAQTRQPEDMMLGTWKLDLTRSTFNSTVPFYGGTPPKSRTMRFERVASGIRHVTDTATVELRETYHLE